MKLSSVGREPLVQSFRDVALADTGAAALWEQAGTPQPCRMRARPQLPHACMPDTHAPVKPHQRSASAQRLYGQADKSQGGQAARACNP